MTKDLIDLGCVPAKSKILQFPNENQVPMNLLSHFIRGYFDGDGYVGLTTANGKPNTRYGFSITSSISFCDQLSKIINNILNVNSKSDKAICLSVKTLRIGKRKNFKIFMEWIYKDATIYLQRKYDTYQKVKSTLNL